MPPQDKSLLHIDYCIKAWESKLRNDRFLMEISMGVVVESTIKHLKRLKELEKEADPNKA